MKRVQVDAGAHSPALVYVFSFLQGFLLAKSCVSVSRQWYATIMQPRLWQSQCESLAPAEVYIPFYDEFSIKLRARIRKQSNTSHTMEISEEARCITITGLGVMNEDLETTTWRWVYWFLLCKACVGCGKSDVKMRFTQLLERALCFSCKKTEQYLMIDNRAARREFGITKQDFKNARIDALKISDPAKPGKTLFVFYKADIVKLHQKKTAGLIPQQDASRSLAKPLKPNLTAAELAEVKLAQKRQLIIDSLQELNIADPDFEKELFETEGNWVTQLYSGRIRVPPSRMLIRLETHYKKWSNARSGCVPSRRKPRENGSGGKSQKTEANKPSTQAPPVEKKPKILTEEEKVTRKKELLDRLLRMGVSPEKVSLDDPDGIAYKYINGISGEDIGPVAGEIWRKNKPVFTGIFLKTCQREEDLGRLGPRGGYGSD